MKKNFPNPRNKQETFFHALNVLVSDCIHQGLSIKALRIIAAVHYLQRRSEEVYVGEIHAVYYEITRDPSWTYESCRNLCNQLSKRGWLEKHKLEGYVAYTLTNKTKHSLGW